MNPPPPFTFDMPSGAQGATVIEGPEGKATVKGRTVLVQGPFPPGKTAVQVGIRPARDYRSVEVEQRFPADLEHLAVIVRKSATPS